MKYICHICGESHECEHHENYILIGKLWDTTCYSCFKKTWNLIGKIYGKGWLTLRERDIFYKLFKDNSEIIKLWLLTGK